MIFEYSPEQIEKMLKICIFHEDKHGLDKQMDHTIKELKELAEELLPKVSNDAWVYDKFKVFSEMFDVEFMIFQLKQTMMKYKKDVIYFNKIVDNNLERELFRWGLDK